MAWFASSEALEEGRRYRLRGTVKRHEEYRGKPRTVLTRCTVLEELPVEDAALV